MRLLDTTTLELKFFASHAPRYAILSHRWEDEEVTFDDLQPGADPSQLKGYSKLENSARMAREAGYQYIWVDTCCINKSSSAELSEAINSMFRWYQNSEHCFAYLSDVAGDVAFRDSQWFTRGWTLQELLAPSEVHFYDKFWEPRGTKKSLSSDIHSVTGIAPEVLLGADLGTVPACCKMSWAAGRVTTRAEDMAYCLMGLFDVNMALLYGEGGEKAFRRLQETFVRESDDESIFAWTTDAKEATKKPYWGLLAASPVYFKDSGSYSFPRFRALQHGGPTEVTNKGLRVSLVLEPLKGDPSGTLFLAPLNCSKLQSDEGDVNNAFTIVLQRVSYNENQFARVRPDRIIAIEGDSQDSDSEQPAMTQLFVRPSQKGSDSVTGFSAKQNQLVKFDFPTNSNTGPKVFEGSAHTEFIGATPWTLRGPKSQHLFFVELKESVPELNPALFEVGKLKKRRIVGCLELRVVSVVTDPDPLSTQKPTSFQMRVDKNIYLFVGFEPLQPNILETPAAFVRPWYSFSNTNDDAVAEDLAASDSNVRRVHRAPGGVNIGVNFSIATHGFRTCHDVELVKVAD